MKALSAILRAVFISPEFLVIVAILGVWRWRPDILELAAKQVASSGEILRYLGLLASGLLAYDISVAKGILLPDDDKLNALQRWEKFAALKVCVSVGLVYALIFAALGIIASMLDWSHSGAFHGAAILVSVLGAGITTGSFIVAQFNIAILIRRHS